MSIASSLLSWTLANSLAAACLCALVWLALRVAGRSLPSRAHYCLWYLVLIRLCLPLVPQASWSLLNGVSLKNWTEPVVPRVPRVSPDAPLDARTAVESSGVVSERQPGQSVATTPVEPIPRSPAPELVRTPRAGGANWLVGLWMAGGLVYLGLVAVQQIRFARRVRFARPGDARCMQLLGECRNKLGLNATVRVEILDALESPVVYGLFRPRLLLPAAELESMPERDLRHVFLHELVHVRRRDAWLNWVWILVRAWHWFNPFVWLALRRTEAEREILCDAEAISVLKLEERVAYGATLLRLAASLPGQKAWPTPGVVSVLSQPQVHILERRIRMIAQPRLFSVFNLALALVLVCLLAGLTFTRAAEKPASATPAEAAVPAAPAPEAIPAPKAARSTMPPPRVRAEQSWQALENELDKNRQVIRDLEDRLMQMKERLGITELDEQGAGGAFSAEALRTLEVKRIEAEAERARSLATYKLLTNASRIELRRMIPTAHPDPLLERLLDETAKLQLQRARFEGEVGPDNMERQRTERMMVTLEKQIEERLDGLLRGLKVVLDSQSEQLDAMRLQIELAKKTDIARSIQRRPYYQLKRELESTLMFQDRLQARLLQDRLDARLQEGR